MWSVETWTFGTVQRLRAYERLAFLAFGTVQRLRAYERLAFLAFLCSYRGTTVSVIACRNGFFKK
jgi:uncharacterized ParB-like nuclease family protein